MTELKSTLAFFLGLIFDLYTFIVLLRFFLQWVGANYYNPISQITVKLTNPIILPLRRILPTFLRIDLSLLLLVFALQTLKMALLLWMEFGTMPPFAGLLFAGFGLSLDKALDLLFYAILLSVIISWVNPGLRSPVTDILHNLTEPLLALVRPLLPVMAGIDFSPVIVILLIQFTKMVIVAKLLHVAQSIILSGMLGVHP